MPKLLAAKVQVQAPFLEVQGSYCFLPCVSEEAISYTMRTLIGIKGCQVGKLWSPNAS